VTHCARGCVWPRLHKNTLRHDDDCPGCLPIDAVQGQWCNRCWGHARTMLSDLPGLATEVATLPEGRLNAGAPPVSDAPRAPSRDPASVSPAFDLGEEAARWLHSWTDTVCEALNLAGPPRYTVTGLPRLDPHGCATFLKGWLSWPAQHEPVQFHDELRSLHYQLERALGVDVPVERIKDPCPRCDLRMLSRADGEDVVCGNEACQSVFRLDEWERIKAGAS